MKVTFFLLISFAFSVLLSSAEAVVLHTSEIYKTTDGNELQVDIFYTSEAVKKGNNPAIAFFHGGGWAYGKPSEFFTACERYAEKGFLCFAFEYRLCINPDESIPNPYITPVECVKDARSAMRWIRANADDFRVDRNRIAAAGQSAGGQLALSTALCDDINEETDDLSISPVPNLLLLYSSNLNTVEAWADHLLGDRREEIWSISPYHRLKKGMPPAIEFHGKEDPQVPFYITEFYKVRTISLGNIFEQHVYEGRAHYLAEGNEKYATYFDEEILEKTDIFLRKYGFFP